MKLDPDRSVAHVWMAQSYEGGWTDQFCLNCGVTQYDVPSWLDPDRARWLRHGHQVEYALGKLARLDLGVPRCQREVLAPVDERRGVEALERLRAK